MTIPDTANDVHLVGRILAGDTHALDRMMRLNNRRLFRVARSILNDDAEAEDAVQDTYIRAYHSLGDFRGEARLSTWLTRIIVNQAIERRRRRARAGSELPDEDVTEREPAPLAEMPEAQAIRSELRQLAEHAIDALPANHRAVFMLRAVEGLSVEETAAALGLSPANTKTSFHRARNRLRDVLGKQIGPVVETLFNFDGKRCDRIVAEVFAALDLAAPRVPAPVPGDASAPGDSHD